MAYAKGITNVTDLAFGRDGSLYAVQIATNGLLKGPKGSLVKVSHTGGKPTVIAGNLPVALRRCGAGPLGVREHLQHLRRGGQVLRIPLP